MHTVRDFINEPRIQYSLFQQDVWNQVCSSLDILEDTHLALDAFGAGEETPEIGDQYLKLYGVLQALTLQQDALMHFSEGVGLSKSLKDYPRLEEIRDIRNKTVGHPTRQVHGRKGLPPAHHFISRFSLSREGFDLLSADGTTHAFSNISVSSLIAEQQTIVNDILHSVLSELKERDAQHRAAFTDDKLEKVFSSQALYALEKVSQAATGRTPAQLGSWGMSEVQRTLEVFRSKLENRGLGTDAYPGVEAVFQELQYPTAQLDAFLAHRPSDITNAESAQVFIHYLQSKLEELKRMAREIDEDFTLR